MTVPDFDDLVGPDIAPTERARLRRVHELLVAAGPPPEIPAALASPPVRGFRRRRMLGLALAAALSVAAFGAGWLTRSGDEFEVRAAVPMSGTDKAAPGAWGKIELGYPDEVGNWEMRVTVAGLKPLPEGGYYELLLTAKGKPVATCGSFKVEADGETTVRLFASYNLAEFDGWIVRPYIHDREKFNETVLLRT